MPIFILGSHPLKNLDMNVGLETCQIEHETDKAYLFRRTKQFPDNTIDEAYWFPKSQCQVTQRPIIRIIKAEPKEVGINTVFHCPDWLWDQRELAKPMGVRP
jgi:hypothetical protein